MDLLEIDDYAFADKVRMDVVRGENWRLRCELYENGGPDNCGTAIAGDPLDLSTYANLVAVGRVSGTDTLLVVQASFIDKGNATRPAIISLLVDAASIEASFADGAQQEFTVTVLATSPGRRDLVLDARVSVWDSAFGANR